MNAMELVECGSVECGSVVGVNTRGVCIVLCVLFINIDHFVKLFVSTSEPPLQRHAHSVADLRHSVVFVPLTPMQPKNWMS